MKTLIIGYGNPYRRDDGLGWRVIETLQADPIADVELLQTLQLMPEHAEEISRFSQVIFVDASMEGKPGELHFEWLHVHKHPSLTYSHYVSPQELLMMAGMLYGHQPEGCLITVTGEDFDLGEGMTEGVEARIPEVIAQIRACLV